jgi:hypothetical protein
MQKTQNNQHHSEREEPSWRTDTTQLQDLLCNDVGQDSVVNEETNGSMEQNRELRKRWLLC